MTDALLSGGMNVLAGVGGGGVPLLPGGPGGGMGGAGGAPVVPPVYGLAVAGSGRIGGAWRSLIGGLNPVTGNFDLIYDGADITLRNVSSVDFAVPPSAFPTWWRANSGTPPGLVNTVDGAPSPVAFIQFPAVGSAQVVAALTNRNLHYWKQVGVDHWWFLTGAGTQPFGSMTLQNGFVTLPFLGAAVQPDANIIKGSYVTPPNKNLIAYTDGGFWSSVDDGATWVNGSPMGWGGGVGASNVNFAWDSVWTEVWGMVTDASGNPNQEDIVLSMDEGITWNGTGLLAAFLAASFLGTTNINCMAFVNVGGVAHLFFGGTNPANQACIVDLDVFGGIPANELWNSGASLGAINDICLDAAGRIYAVAEYALPAVSSEIIYSDDNGLNWNSLATDLFPTAVSQKARGMSMTGVVR